MDIVHGDEMVFEKPNIGHRQRGKITDKDSDSGETISFKTLICGEEGSPENFSFQLARQSEFYSPRHKHNFDQFRYALKGDFSIGKGVTLREGQLGYFPEGTPYGPQDDAEGERILLVLQFGGISGQGYMSKPQLQQAASELRKEGRFEDGGFIREGGGPAERQDGFEAVWEFHNKKKLIYSRPRYRDPIVINPDAFTWIDGEGEGIKVKPLGAFTERQTRAALIGLEAKSRFRVAPEEAARLIFVNSGSGVVGGQQWRTETAIHLKPGEDAAFSADERSQMLMLVLPRLRPVGELPVTERAA